MSKNKILFTLIFLLIICISILYKLQRLNINEAFVENSIMPSLKSGLGNQLFNLATVYGISREYNKPIAINRSEVQNSPHTKINYIDTVFQNFKEYFTDDKAEEHIPFETKEPELGTLYKDNKKALSVKEYNHFYQNFDKYRSDFINMLSFDTSVATKYDKLSNSAFIHVRGGDYTYNGMFFMDLEEYYKKAIKQCNERGTNHFYLFTNDMDYVKEKFPFVLEQPHTVVNENELDSLYLMSKCQLGGVASNSTFSWWGLYLNLDRPNLIIPSKWFVNYDKPNVGLFHPAFTVMDA
jgi:hypothetical protein